MKGLKNNKSRAFLNEFYTEDKNERQIFDLVFPENASGKLGLILCIHGGGWVEGNKEPYTKSLFQVSEEKGIAAACMNYRYVSEKINFDDQLNDIASALSAIRKKGKEFGVDFEKVLLTGISAGGHLSLLYAFTRKASSPVKPVCVVELCGPSDLENPFFYSEKTVSEHPSELNISEISSAGESVMILTLIILMLQEQR